MTCATLTRRIAVDAARGVATSRRAVVFVLGTCHCADCIARRIAGVVGSQTEEYREAYRASRRKGAVGG